MSTPMKLYGSPTSGNTYKVRLLLAHLHQPYEWVEALPSKGETRTREFLDKNPAGKVPVLELPNGETLWESGALLYHLAQNTPFWPRELNAQTQVLQWMFFEQYSHQPYIAIPRILMRNHGRDDGSLPPEVQANIEQRRPQGFMALDVMEERLRETEWLAAGQYTIADMALYAYTHVAHEGGYDIEGYAAIQGWMKLIEAQPGYTQIYGPIPHQD